MKIKKKRPGTDHFLTYKEEKTKRLKESEVREINARERENVCTALYSSQTLTMQHEI